MEILTVSTRARCQSVKNLCLSWRDCNQHQVLLDFLLILHKLLFHHRLRENKHCLKTHIQHIYFWAYRENQLFRLNPTEKNWQLGNLARYS